jgi:hypothetical protein
MLDWLVAGLAAAPVVATGRSLGRLPISEFGVE